MPLRRRTTFTLHALDRVAERLSLSWEELAKILDGDLNVTVGVDTNTNRLRRLFFSEADNEYFVAVQDAATGDVITVLPLEYHANSRELVHERHILALARLLDQEPPDTTRMPGVFSERRRLSLPKDTVHITKIRVTEAGNVVKRKLGAWRPLMPIANLAELPRDAQFTRHIRRLAEQQGVAGEPILSLALRVGQSREVTYVAIDLSDAAARECQSQSGAGGTPQATRVRKRIGPGGSQEKGTVNRFHGK